MSFPKCDEVQKRRRHWQAQKHRMPRLRRPLMQRAQNSLSASTFSCGQPLSWDVDGNSLLQNRASSDTSKVEMDSNSISKTVPRCFLSCEAETARDTHLRMASSLATATIRRRLRYIRTRRTLWKLTGRSWTNPSRCRQELNPQIQEGTQRRRWSTDCRLWTKVKQLYETIMRVNEMFKGTTNLLQMQQLCSSLRKALTLSDL